MPQLLHENEVSLARLQEVFEAAFIENDVDSDGDLVVRTENGTKIFIGLSETNRLIRFTAVYGLAEDASEGDKQNLANTLNDGIILVRFSVSSGSALVCDYYLPFNGGVLPLHIVTAIRLFNRIISSSLQSYDTQNIVS